MGEAVKLVELPFSEHGLTIAVMDSNGNVQIRTEEPIPEGFQDSWQPTKEAVKLMASGERGRFDIFPEMG